MDTTALTVDDIVFSALSTHEWRISDRRYSRHEIDALLGFVARKGDDFYLTRMHHPLEPDRLGSFDEVARFLVSGAGVATAARSEFAGS